MPDPVGKPEATNTKVYFHVTTQRRLKSIRHSGIEPNHNRRWKTGFGKALGDRGSIYLISDFTSAVRWAHKMEWEHYAGKTPEKSPYVIICVRENPKNLQPDPHPEAGLYGHTWFQKAGSIPPEDILKVIPLTRALIKQVATDGEAVLEDNVRGVTSFFSAAKCIRALEANGWRETTVPGMFRNAGYPEYSVDVDIHNPHGGPYTLYRGGTKLGNMKLPPVAQHLGLKDKLTDRSLPEPETDEWDFRPSSF